MPEHYIVHMAERPFTASHFQDMHCFMGRATVIQQTILLNDVKSHFAIAYRLPRIQSLMMVLHLGTSCLGCNMSIPPTCNMHIIRAARSQTTHLACHRLSASSRHLPLSVSAPHHLAQPHHPNALHLQNHRFKTHFTQ